MSAHKQEQRILVMAPVGQDAPAIAALLQNHGLAVQVCANLGEVCASLTSGAGAILLTEEAFELPRINDLLEQLQAQPSWSEVPLIILTRGGEPRYARLLEVAASAARGVTLLERPLGSATLLRSVEMALRSRHRQYQVRDLIEQERRSKAQLEESEQRYRMLVEQVKDYAIFRIDKQGRASSWNEGVQRVLGFNETQFINRDLHSIFTDEDVQAGVPEQELREAAQKGAAGDDRWMLRADGSPFFATGVTTALRNQAGELVGYTKVLRDSTALADARAKLEAHAINLERVVAERTKDLQATNEQLEAFVYSIAHDLRTPLRALTGYSQLLQDDYAGRVDPAAKNLLSRIHNAAEFMDKLLLDLLAFGRTARAHLELGPVPVQKAWDSALFQCASQIEQTRAQIETVKPLPCVMAHEATLGQCLVNLLGNSLKFTQPGVPPRIRFWAEPRDVFVCLMLQDNGLGIPPDQQDRVFRVFERLHGSRYPGTGIGLSIVRKGVERMGGTVGLESELGKGSRFWIELPAANTR